MWRRIEDLHHCLKHYGKRIVDRLMDCGIWEKTLGTAFTSMSMRWICWYKSIADTMVVHNPESNMGNAWWMSSDHENRGEGDPDRLGTDDIPMICWNPTR